MTGPGPAIPVASTTHPHGVPAPPEIVVASFAIAAYRKPLAAHGIKEGGSRQGDCGGGVAAKSFWATLEHELLVESGFHLSQEARRAICEFHRKPVRSCPSALEHGLPQSRRVRGAAAGDVNSVSTTSCRAQSSVTIASCRASASLTRPDSPTQERYSCR